MTTLLYLIAIVAAVLMLPQLLKFIVNRIDVLPGKLQELSIWMFKTGLNLLTNNGQMAPREVIGLTGGSFILSVSFIALAIMAYFLFAPALAPLMGLKTDAVAVNGLASLAKVTIAAAVIVPICAGIWVTDLIGWSRLSAVAKFKKGRLLAFMFAVFTLLWSISFGLDAGLYRATIMMADVIGADTAQTYSAYMAAFMLISTDALVLIGVFLSSVGIEATALFAFAVLVFVFGVFLYLLGLVIEIAAVFLKPVCEFLLHAYELIASGTQGSFRKMKSGLDSFVG